MKLLIKDIHCVEVGPRQTQVALILGNYATYAINDDGKRTPIENEEFNKILTLKGKVVNIEET